MASLCGLSLRDAYVQCVLLQICKFLLEQEGANLNARDNKGTPGCNLALFGTHYTHQLGHDLALFGTHYTHQLGHDLALFGTHYTHHLALSTRHWLGRILLLRHLAVFIYTRVRSLYPAPR